MKKGDVLFWMSREVKVMAIAEKWAMVRRKGCVPFCILVTELEDAQRERVCQCNENYTVNFDGNCSNCYRPQVGK